MTFVSWFKKNKMLVNSQYLKLLIASMGLIFSGQLSAAAIAIASSPLVNSSNAQVLPNLMYILDNSGSMSSNFMPDYVDGDPNMCKTTGTGGAFSAGCTFGDPPYNSKEFNYIYYNPEITYSPPLNADGTERQSMTSANTAGWTQVMVDGYGVQRRDQLNNNVPGNLISLVPSNVPNGRGYPDRVWCNINNASSADLFNATVCKQNTQYVYPSNDGTTLGSFNQPYTKLGYPYYYNISPGQYCTDSSLRNCTGATAPVGAFTVPAKLRWCNSAARTNCQARYIDATGYTFALWTGVQNGAAPIATIKINPDTVNGASPVNLSVTGITVNGVSIIPAVPNPALTILDTTNSGQRSTLATRIVTAINAFVPTGVATDFTATSSGDTVTIRPVGVTGSYSGTLDMTTTKYPTTAFLGVKAVGSFTITKAQAPMTVNNIKVGGIDILGVPQVMVGADTPANRILLASKIVTQINGFPSTPDYVATSDGASSPKITITAKNAGVLYNGSLNISFTKSGSGSFSSSSVTNLVGGVNEIDAEKYTLPNTLTQFAGGTPTVNTFNRVDIEPAVLSYPKAGSRTDCGDGTSTTCTYDEEMTNFANWYTYYRTRMQMMKTSTSRAFKLIDQRYRVGFITINNPTSNNASGRYLPIADFSGAQKTNWYAALASISPGNGTPLRTALSTTGQIFAGKKPIGNSDPVQYSCQQNFSLLTTDGYWNGGGGTQVDGTTGIGNLDGAGTGRPQFEGPVATTNTLADVSKYYYDTDLRSTALGNCTGALGTNVCENNVFVSPTDNNIKQHMTTFTLGLGVDGQLGYTPDYKTAATGDYYDIKQGTRNWPAPLPDRQTAVDDLWHAAVNGEGSYFSARDPSSLNRSLNDALQTIGSKIGAGAAAASSTLNPVEGDNSAYVASYATVKWSGNLEARSINTSTGEVSKTAIWCVENVLSGVCTLPSSVVSEDVFGSTQAFCVTPGSNTTTCDGLGGSLSGTNCKVQIPLSCTGAMVDNVGAAVSNRKILMKNGNSATPALVDFTYANLTAAQKVYFEKPFLSTNLSHWSALSAAQQNIAYGENLVNYLRGESGYEDRASNSPPSIVADNRVFRFREATLGDALESTPLFSSKPRNGYSDANYGPVSNPISYKAVQANRPGTVYMGTNDGMLHAFDAANGEERWAYIPSMVIPNLYKLADRTYSTHHQNYINGDARAVDVCVANCSVAGSGGAQWKTLLIGGLNGGGSGYYALDITDPVNPKLLWEFTQDNDGDLGISYGRPLVTKKADGTWVVLITSGYNNTLGANPGKGFLYVLNPITGVVISKLGTGAGDATTPSGLAKISGYANLPATDNTATYIYGGDLLGNVWRFDINLLSAIGSNPFKLTTLLGSNGNAQPITVAPEMAEVEGKRFILIGTGKYLEIPDLTDTQPQTLYGFTDDDLNVTLVDPRNSTKLVKQELEVAGGSRKIKQPANTVDYVNGRGWYIDLPDSGERQNVAGQLVAGTYIVPSIVPSSTVCSPGGYGWLNYLDYRTGAAVQTATVTPTSANLASTKFNAPIVGVNVFKIGDKFKVNTTIATSPDPELTEVPFGSPGGTKPHRVIWRELIDQE
jgi:type IV pilus assembly protein PilY1